jgi:hypothetical protein
LDVGVDEHLFKTGLIRVFAFFIVLQVFKYLVAVNHKQADVFIYLGCGQAYAVAVVHGFPHIGNELFKAGVVFVYVFADCSQYRRAVGYYWEDHNGRKTTFLSVLFS